MNPALCHVVIGADGVVLGADGDAASWIGTSLQAHSDVSEAVRRAAADVVATVRDPSRRASVASRIVAGTPDVEITAVEAVPIRRSEVGLRALLEDALGPLREQANASEISLTLEAEADLPPLVLIDPEKFAWAVSMLVGNALRYAKHGSRLRPGGEIAVRVARDPADGGLLMTVTDDGPGIPRENLPSLFKRSQRSERATGLALMLLSDIVSAHGGRIAVESSTDKWSHGTKFTIWLPTR
jgi:signal transduction histidine kinase